MSFISRLGWLLGHVTRHPCNRHRRIRAVFRVLWWQARKRLTGRAAIVRVGSTRRFKAVCDSPFSSMVIYNQLPDWDEMNFLLRFLRAGDGFIDIGANVGFYTVLASTVVTEGPLLAFEPNPRNVAVLREQVKLNELANVEIFSIALGDSNGDLSFDDWSREEGALAGGTGRQGKLITIPCSRLDSCLENRELPSCTVAKMDVEGCEMLVLAGASDTLERCRISVWLFELSDGGLRSHGGSEAGLIEVFVRYGYSILYWDEEQRRIGSRGDECDTGRGNYLACRNVTAVRARIAGSPGAG